MYFFPLISYFVFPPYEGRLALSWMPGLLMLKVTKDMTSNAYDTEIKFAA